MAFNFKWSPLAADQSFYTRAQELLTGALNKSPKPPIIVDDIVVTELNLGQVPPDLEVLEISDIDVDRFRGMFKMAYTGNAFLTLRTKVQANPLNTYLSTKPDFTSPRPLAASSGLTIPIAITLSEIKLSAIIMLVYSGQKGITLVFRNDPLDSLKVSSTFDAIPFVRDYLQKEIEKQLRTLLMDELPLIIHRLSLRLFNKECSEDLKGQEDEQEANKQDIAVDPLSDPPSDLTLPNDTGANTQEEGTPLALEAGPDSHLLFSQKNLIRLGALTDSHKTLSLFTPTIRDTVFRAWTGPLERGELRSTSGAGTPAIPRSLSYAGGLASLKHVVIDSPDRPHSACPGSISRATSLAESQSSKPQRRRRRKHRVVNLRSKNVDGSDLESVSEYSTTTSMTGTSGTGGTGMSASPITQSSKNSRPLTPEPAMEEPGNLDVGQTPPRYLDLKLSSHVQAHDSASIMALKREDVTPRPSTCAPILSPPTSSSSRSSPQPPGSVSHSSKSDFETIRRPGLYRNASLQSPGKQRPKLNLNIDSTMDDTRNPSRQAPFPVTLQEGQDTQERHDASSPRRKSTWTVQVSGDILRQLKEQKMDKRSIWQRAGSFDPDSVDDPPPAYVD